MKRPLGTFAVPIGAVLLVGLGAVRASGHAGPAFPIVQDRIVGAYEVSVWTDPDTTDDGTPGGQFWVIVHSSKGGPLGRDTRVTVSARPLDRDGAAQRGLAARDEGASSQYFAGLVLDHEGRWRIDVSLEGPLGPAATSAEVAATYDLRPSLGVLPFLVLPFVLVGFLWLKALRSRRGKRPRGPS